MKKNCETSVPRCENQNLYSARLVLVLLCLIASEGLLVAIARIAAKREEDQVPFATLRSCVFSSVLLRKCRCKCRIWLAWVNVLWFTEPKWSHYDEEWWLMTMIPTMNDEWWRVNMVNGGHTCLVVTSMTSPLAGADCRIDRNLTGSFGAPGSRPRASTRNTLITLIPIH